MYKYELELLKKGSRLIAGCDEVGRGPLAGPVVAAAVILDPNDKIIGLNDSKKLSETKRNILDKEIRERALCYSIAYIWPDEIDAINIYQASKKAMIQAIRSLKQCPEHILSDAMPLDGQVIPFTSIIKGDQNSASIAAASILAKVDRDRYMKDLAKEYPMYHFDKHKGYPTKIHLAALTEYGVTKHHRRSYKPVRDLLEQQLRFDI